MYALNGLAGNPINQGMTVQSMVERAMNIGVSMANRWEQMLGTANLRPQHFSTETLATPATPTINFTASVGATVNDSTRSSTRSTTTTTVKDPDGGSIADRGSAVS